MDIVGVQSHEFDRISHHVEWHFQSFEDRSRGLSTADHLKEQVRLADKQCWLAVEDRQVRACALTEVNDGHFRTVTVTHCAGRGRKDWQEPIILEIKAWAESIGAERLLTINRPGYARFLKDMGFRETHRVMEQDLWAAKTTAKPLQK